jgi:hypothetical protein
LESWFTLVNLSIAIEVVEFLPDNPALRFSATGVSKECWSQGRQLLDTSSNIKPESRTPGVSYIHYNATGIAR